MTFTFDDTIPAANNNPSDDQPVMLANNVANLGIWDVDHVGFNVSNGGQHKLVRFNVKATPAAPTDPQSALYTNSGTASTNASLFFVNQNATYLVNAIKAFGVFTTQNVNGAVALTNGVNVSSITASSSGTVYTIALTPNAVSGTTPVVFCQLSNNNGLIGWTYALNTLTITINIVSTAGNRLTFQILQV